MSHLWKELSLIPLEQRQTASRHGQPVEVLAGGDGSETVPEMSRSEIILVFPLVPLKDSLLLFHFPV